MKALTFDTSCVLNLLRAEEEVDEALLRLLRLAFDARVTIAVTHVVDREVPPTATNYIRSRLAAFPVLKVSPEREAEHEALAARFCKTLWPKANPTSAKSDHNRRDSSHLAAHRLCGRSVFVTRDNELKKKVAQHAALGVVVRSPEELVSEVEPNEQTRTRPGRFDIAVRGARDDDAEAIKELLRPVHELYPKFDEWLLKTLRGADTRVALGIVEGKVAGISVWKPKDARVAKLSTFFIGEPYRDGGLGPHLLFHQIREWVERRVEKVVVTVASRLATVIPFFLQYGFRIEGLAGRRYKRGEPEVVLAKHFIYESVAAGALGSFIEGITDLWTVPPAASTRARTSWFLPPVAIDRVQLDETAGRVDVRGEAQSPINGYTLGELEELLYPLRLGVDARRAYLIPIRPQWASRMMQAYEAAPTQIRLFAEPIDKLLLRTDNAYYCFPRYGPLLLEHAPVLFYVSGEVGAVTGMARVLECHVETPEDLFLRFGDIGVYPLRNIKQHVQRKGKDAGCAMALRFGWWVPFPHAVSLAGLRQLGLAHPQSITALDYANYEAILASGGIEW